MEGNNGLKKILKKYERPSLEIKMLNEHISN